MKLMLVGKAARGKTTLLMRVSERGQRGIQENWGTKRWAGGRVIGVLRGGRGIIGARVWVPFFEGP